MSGLDDGYDFGNKRQYRRIIWAEIDRRMRKPIADRHVFILDTKEGLEVEFLIRRGYRPDHIHVCNENAAQVSVLTMKLLASGADRVNTYGVPIGKALKRIKKLGIKLDAIHADFCANLTDQLVDWLDDIRGGSYDQTVIAVNMLRGRELGLWQIARDSMLRRGVKTDLAGDYARLRTVVGELSGAMGESATCCHFHPQKLRWGSYLSTSGQTMLWLIVTLRTHRIAIQDPELQSSLLYACNSRNNGYPEEALVIPMCMVTMGTLNHGATRPLTVRQSIEWLASKQPDDDGVIICSMNQKSELRPAELLAGLPDPREHILAHCNEKTLQRTEQYLARADKRYRETPNTVDQAAITEKLKQLPFIDI